MIFDIMKLPTKNLDFLLSMWDEPRIFSKYEAMMDILNMVTLEEDSHFEYIGGKQVYVGYGEWPASIRFLAKRWKWSENAVRRFLRELKRKKFCSTDCSQGVNVIRILNL